MANSTGTAGFNVDRDTLVTAALRVIRVADPEGGMTPTSTMLSNGAEALNMLIKNWEAQGLILSTYDQIAIPLTSSKNSYTIGPSGADVTSVRPIRLFDGSFIRQTLAGVVTDTDLTLLTRQAYFQETTKAVNATANSIYYFPGIDVAGGVTNPGTGWGTLFVYSPVAASATYTVYANFQRPLYDMTNATDAFDLPQEWFRALKFGLAADLCPEYGLPSDFANYIMQLSASMKLDLFQWTRDQAIVAFGEQRSREERARDATTTKG